LETIEVSLILAGLDLDEVAWASTSMLSDHPGVEHGFEQSLRASREHRGQLFGRDIQVTLLQEAYRRAQATRLFQQSSPTENENHDCRSELVVIQGATGTGKTALAHSIQSLVEKEDGGYFLRVSFDAIEGNEPYQAQVEALTDFLERVMDRGDSQSLKLGMRQAGLVRSRACAPLIEKVPLLRTFIGYDVAESSGTKINTEELDALNRMRLTSPLEARVYSGGSFNAFKDALCLFVQSATLMAKPIAFLLDDLHLANECSIDVIQALMEYKSIHGVLFIGTMESEPSSHVDRMLCKLREACVRQTRLALSPLIQADVHDLVRHALCRDIQAAYYLASALMNYSKGNVALIWESLRLLHKKGILQTDHSTGQCVWLDKDVRLDTMNVSGAIRSCMQSLPSSDVEVIKLASCLGVKLDFDLLSRLTNRDAQEFDVFARSVAQLDVLVYHSARKCWCFSNSTVRGMVYDMIPVSERPVYHYRIGRKLWRTLDLEELNEFIFLVVEQLTFCVDALKENAERTAVAKLCLAAGLRAFHFSCFNASMRYLECGISLVDRKSWKDDYTLCLDLHSAAAEMGTVLGQSERVFGIVETIISNAQVFTDSLRARATLVHALGCCGRHAEATKLALEVLNRLGEPLKLNPSRLRLVFEFVSLKRRLKAKSNESIMRLPHMEDASKLAAMQMLNLVVLSGILANPALVPLVGFRMVRLTLDHGLCAVSCVGFVLFAGLLCRYD
jgi:predicted ATPase